VASPAAGSATPAKAAPQIDSDVATIDVDDLEPLEPLAEAASDEGDFSLSWLEEEDSASPLTDSIGANGASAADTAAVKKTIAAKETAPGKKPAPKKDAAPDAKARAPQGKATPPADSDSLGDLDDLCN
jgi:hypothetical protein